MAPNNVYHVVYSPL